MLKFDDTFGFVSHFLWLFYANNGKGRLYLSVNETGEDGVLGDGRDDSQDANANVAHLLQSLVGERL